MSTQATQQHTVALAAFEGWNDAGQAATGLIRHLIDRYDSCEIRHIRSDDFYDYQVARPMLCHVTGRRRILWPQTTFYDITICPDLRIIAQIAPEPNYRWQAYCQECLMVHHELEVDTVITVGSMLDDCPHTRPLPIEITTGSCQCELDREYNGPIGIPTILDDYACKEGLQTASLWASIPQYASNDECFQATLQLLDGLSDVLNTPLNSGELPLKAEQWKARVDECVHRDGGLEDYIRHLEQNYDMREYAKNIAATGAPAAEQLVKEAEDFLKKHPR